MVECSFTNYWLWGRFPLVEFHKYSSLYENYRFFKSMKTILNRFSLVLFFIRKLTCCCSNCVNTHMWCFARSGTILQSKSPYSVQIQEIPATLLKITLFHGCFSRFLNCTNGTKSRKAPHIQLQRIKYARIRVFSDPYIPVFKDKIFDSDYCLFVVVSLFICCFNSSTG